MKLYKRAIILSILIIGSLALNAQSFKAEYTYDENGNRISATVVYIAATPQGSSPKVEDELKIDSDNILHISIFPNPTQGDLRLDLNGATPEQLGVSSNAIRVWDVQGKLLLTISPIETSNRVDFSNLTGGIYILQLFFDGKVKDFRIIKK